MSNDGETATQIGEKNGKTKGKKLLMCAQVCECVCVYERETYAKVSK